jgi:hypothetical protein
MSPKKTPATKGRVKLCKVPLNEHSSNNIIDTAMDAKFMADAEQKPEEELAAHTAFDVEQQRRREAAAAKEESDDKDFKWTRPNP